MKDTKLTLTLVVFTSLLLSSCSSLGSAVSAAASAGTSAVGAIIQQRRASRRAGSDPLPGGRRGRQPARCV